MSLLERYLLWVAGGTLMALAIAWAAFQIQQQGFAPAVLFPLGIGSVLGGALSLLNRVTKLSGVLLVTLCAVGWALLLVITQDYIGHRTRLAALDDQIAASHPLAAAMSSETDMRPTFDSYLMARFRQQPIWWPVDLGLVVAGSCGVVFLGASQQQTADRPRATPSQLENRGRGSI
jgi:hypothetical protein